MANPLIRFDGFYSDWESKQLGDVAQVIKRVNANSQSPVMMISAAQGFIKQANRYSSDNAGKSLAKYVELYKGDLAYNHGASRLRPYGACFTLKEDSARVPFVYHCFAVPDENPVFMAVQLNHPRIDKQLSRLITSGARLDGLLNISYEAYENVEVARPSVDEQNAIAGFVASLEKRIDEQDEKLIKLQNLKRSLLVKMFPQHGSAVPEIRFAGYNDEWERDTLGEIGSTYGGLSGKSKKDFGHGEARYITYINVFSNSVSDPDMLGRVEIDASQNEVEIGDVLFTTSSETPEEVGMSSVVMEKRDVTYLNSFCFGFRPRLKLDLYFLAYMLRSSGVRADFKVLAQGISRFNISKRKAMEILVPIPSKEEQRAIGAYFYNLDELISSEFEKLDKMKSLKTAFLDKMFV